MSKFEQWKREQQEKQNEYVLCSDGIRRKANTLIKQRGKNTYFPDVKTQIKNHAIELSCDPERLSSEFMCSLIKGNAISTKK